jgi:ribosomal protein S18 acetylase RimI-like enzyme
MMRMMSPDLGHLRVRPAADAAVGDTAIADLLHRAYVGGGFTDPEQATSMFEPSVVRSRGDLLVVEDDSGGLIGMVIVMTPTAPGRKLAAHDEAEMQLLAVAPEHQGRGIGRLLVRAAVSTAVRLGFAKMVLWTQPAMHAAQRLYADEGFTRAPERDFRRADGRSFLVFVRSPPDLRPVLD